MLGHTYRYVFRNDTGVSINFTLKTRDFKFASDGARTDAAEATLANNLVLAANTFTQTSLVDNSTAATKFLGTDATFSATLNATGSGSVTVWLQRSTDGGTTWPSYGQGEWVATVTFPTSSASGTVLSTNIKVR